MSDEKPWLERWEAGDRFSIDAPDREVLAWGRLSTEADASLIAAAPQLARALALVEWNVDDGFCNTCNYYRHKHAAECIVDAALTAAGLDTAEKREEARRWGT